jgi:hypothetical protein
MNLHAVIQFNAYVCCDFVSRTPSNRRFAGRADRCSSWCVLRHGLGLLGDQASERTM